MLENETHLPNVDEKLPILSRISCDETVTFVRKDFMNAMRTHERKNIASIIRARHNLESELIWNIDFITPEPICCTNVTNNLSTIKNKLVKEVRNASPSITIEHNVSDILAKLDEISSSDMARVFTDSDFVFCPKCGEKMRKQSILCQSGDHMYCWSPIFIHKLRNHDTYVVEKFMKILQVKIQDLMIPLTEYIMVEYRNMVSEYLKQHQILAKQYLDNQPPYLDSHIFSDYCDSSLYASYCTNLSQPYVRSTITKKQDYFDIQTFDMFIGVVDDGIIEEIRFIIGLDSITIRNTDKEKGRLIHITNIPLCAVALSPEHCDFSCIVKPQSVTRLDIVQQNISRFLWNRNDIIKSIHKYEIIGDITNKSIMYFVGGMCYIK